MISTDSNEAFSMGDENKPSTPEWSVVAVRLLQGVVYQEDHAENWEILQRSVSALADYFGKIGLMLVVDQNDAMAYLQQCDSDTIPVEWEHLPRLFRRSPMGYEATLLCVLLRDELRRFEETDLQNDRCLVAQSDLLDAWRSYFPEDWDAVRCNRSLHSALRKLEELKFVRPFEGESSIWEIRRIIKARIPLSELEQLSQNLMRVAEWGTEAKSNAEGPESPGKFGRHPK